MLLTPFTKKMNIAAKTEFYADLVVDKIDTLFKTFYKIIGWIWPTVFLIFFFSLWFLPKNMLKIGEDIGLRLLAQMPISTEASYTLALMPFWLWIVGEMLAWAVKMVRKYVMCPKADFTETASVPILKKELIVHRRGKTKGSFSYYFTVKHPVSNDLIKIEVNTAETFEKINEGDMVQIKHLLTPTNILYVSI